MLCSTFVSRACTHIIAFGNAEEEGQLFLLIRFCGLATALLAIRLQADCGGLGKPCGSSANCACSRGQGCSDGICKVRRVVYEQLTSLHVFCMLLKEGVLHFLSSGCRLAA